jgi:hypothetical protein
LPVFVFGRVEHVFSSLIKLNCYFAGHDSNISWYLSKYGSSGKTGVLQSFVRMSKKPGI